MKYALLSWKELCFAIDFLIDNIYVRFGNSVLRQVVGIPIGNNGAPLLVDLFLHIYEYDLLYAYNNDQKQDMVKAVSFGNTSRYIRRFIQRWNNEGFGDYISAPIYPPELELKETTMATAFR